MPVPKVYFFLVVFVAIIALNVASIFISKHDARRVVDENNRKLCSLLVAQDEAYQLPPGPTTDIGQRIAEEVHLLRREYGCG